MEGIEEGEREAVQHLSRYGNEEEIESIDLGHPKTG